MTNLHHRAAALGAGLTAALVLVTGQPFASAMRQPGVQNARVTSNHVLAGAGWLTTQFVDGTHLPHPDGNRFGAAFGGTWYPDYGLDADAIFGLAAARAGNAKLHDALGYLSRHVHAYTGISKQHPKHRAYDGSVGKLAVAAIVAGARPRNFGGFNLLRVLRRDECVRASKPGGPCAAPGAAANIYSSISESFVILAEARGGSGPSPAARAYFTSLQCANGGFTDLTTACGKGKARIDETSYAVMALQAMGGESAALARAVRYLRSKERPGGYWVTQGSANVDSTGLAAAALAGVHRSVRSARGWLVSQQVPAGHRGAGAFRYQGGLVPTTTSATSTSVIATAQALTGLSSDGTLATLTSAGARRIAPMYQPRAFLPHTTVRRGSHPRIRGIGFAAGEQVRVRLPDGRVVGRGTAGPLGVVRTRFHVPQGLHRGRHTVVIRGVASRLAARHTFTVGSAAGAASATYAAAQFGSAARVKPTHVAILIGGKGARCVAWHRGLTGDQALNEVATVTYRSDGIILQIDGSPKSDTADDTHYWSYWHDVSGSWRYSSEGASSYQPAAGTVDGWAYDNGHSSAPPPKAAPQGLYQSICGSKDRASAPPSPTPSPKPTSTTSSHSSAPTRAPHHRHTAAPPKTTARPTVTPTAPTPPRHPAHSPRTHATSAHPATARHRAPRTTSSAAAGGRSTVAPRPRRTSSAPPLLTKPTAQPTNSSPVPTLIAVAVVALLLAGGAVFALRRRRLQ